MPRLPTQVEKSIFTSLSHFRKHSTLDRSSAGMIKTCNVPPRQGVAWGTRCKAAPVR